MRSTRPFRFAVTAHSAPSGDAWRELATRTEDLGYSTLFVSDHLGDQLAPIPALTAAAAATTRLRVGMLVAANDFRHPVVHANELATLDVLSEGRVEWGMGAGWLAPEFHAAGIPFPDAPTRVERLQEAISVMRACFADAPATFAGDHYRVTELDARPKPLQRPHPPLLVGGAERRMLTHAARHADIVGVNPTMRSRTILGRPPKLSVEAAVDQQIGWIREAARERSTSPELNMVGFPTAVTDDRDRRAVDVAPTLGLDPAEVLVSPHVLLGTVDELCEQLEARRARWGVSFWTVPAGQVDAFAPVVERLTGR